MAVSLMSGSAVFCVGMPDPAQEGRRLFEPVRPLFTGRILPEQPFALSIALVVPESRPEYSLTFRLKESLRHATLDDRLDVLVPPPDYLISPPVDISLDPGTEALAPLVTFSKISD